MPTPIESMRIVSAKLEKLNLPFAFVGGAVIVLLVDQPTLLDIRPTKDVDVIIEVGTLAELYALENPLRSIGFRHDVSEGAPICRWIVEGCKVDLMPVELMPLGMTSNWFSEALKLSETQDLGEGKSVQIITAPFFIATKLEAFKNRGEEDFYGSHDLEDIITLLDGRATIIQEITTTLHKVRNFIASEFQKMLGEPDFHDAFPGHLSALSKQRVALVMERIVAIAALSEQDIE